MTLLVCGSCGAPRLLTPRTLADCVLAMYPLTLADATPAPSPRALLVELRQLATAVLAEQARVCVQCFEAHRDR